MTNYWDRQSKRTRMQMKKLNAEKEIKVKLIQMDEMRVNLKKNKKK